MSQLTTTVRLLAGVTSVASSRTHSVVIDRPRDKGGRDLGFLGGELLLAGEGGCFMSNLVAAANARGIEIPELCVTVTGDVADSPQRFSRIQVVAHLRGIEAEEAEKLCLIARRSCIVTNTIQAATDLRIVTEVS